MKDNLVYYAGIMDTHGLESFSPLEEVEKHLGMLEIRCRLNAQRKCLLFKVLIDQNDADKISTYLEEENPKYALEQLKYRSITIYTPGGDRDIEVYNSLPYYAADEERPTYYKHRHPPVQHRHMDIENVPDDDENQLDLF